MRPRLLSALFGDTVVSDRTVRQRATPSKLHPRLWGQTAWNDSRKLVILAAGKGFRVVVPPGLRPSRHEIVESAPDLSTAEMRDRWGALVLRPATVVMEYLMRCESGLSPSLRSSKAGLGLHVPRAWNTHDDMHTPLCPGPPGLEVAIVDFGRHAILLWWLQLTVTFRALPRLRCFPTKAIQIWNQTNDMEHIFVVGQSRHRNTNLFRCWRLFSLSVITGTNELVRCWISFICL